MSIKLYHHPWSRAANVIWMLEELGVPYELEFVDIQKGAQKAPSFLALNPMGKLPTLVDDGVVLTESAAIALWLADRYSLGNLAPALDDPARATYYRWILFGPSVIEPGATAHAGKWEVRPGAVGWGTWESMHDTIEHAIGDGPWLLGDRFTMADVCFGGTVGFMLQFDMIEKRPSFVAYAERLATREARQRSNAINQRITAEHHIGG
ncbi:MAG: glutathione S-transferase family protein [Alphaproteobacteria bacterium]|nr:glutathione S-transferase family protein [Alphaproteobacteria bacterium]